MWDLGRLWSSGDEAEIEGDVGNGVVIGWEVLTLEEENRSGVCESEA